MSMSEMQQGWDFTVQLLGANSASTAGKSYVDDINNTILDLEKNINTHPYRNLGIDQLQGYMFEEWSAGTFNVDAVATGSRDRATVKHLNSKFSVDIHLESGADYSAKSYRNGAESAKQQALINPETGKAGYGDQIPLVPEDHLSDGRIASHNRALRNKEIRPDVSSANEYTEKNLTDRISNSEGIESQSIKRKELEKIAKESKEQKFKAEDHCVTAQNAIKTEYVLKKAMRAGLTAAAITAAVQLAPEIYKSIDYLIKNGEIDSQQIQQMGLKGISAGVEGFLNGSISAAIVILCEAGKLGEKLKGLYSTSMGPSIIGSVVVIIMQTVKNSILVASGKMSAREMGMNLVNSLVISSGYLASMKIGGAIAQALFPEVPGVAFAIGSLLGCCVSVVYNIGKNKFISFCADTGFTCFGLVDQDYQLSDEMLKELGIETIPIIHTQVDTVDIQRTNVARTEIERTEYETVGFTVLRRGVLGVNKIGYVLA